MKMNAPTIRITGIELEQGPDTAEPFCGSAEMSTAVLLRAQSSPRLLGPLDVRHAVRGPVREARPRSRRRPAGSSPCRRLPAAGLVRESLERHHDPPSGLVGEQQEEPDRRRARPARRRPDRRTSLGRATQGRIGGDVLAFERADRGDASGPARLPTARPWAMVAPGLASADTPLSGCRCPRVTSRRTTSPAPAPPRGRGLTEDAPDPPRSPRSTGARRAPRRSRTRARSSLTPLARTLPSASTTAAPARPRARTARTRALDALHGTRGREARPRRGCVPEPIVRTRARARAQAVKQRDARNSEETRARRTALGRVRRGSRSVACAYRVLGALDVACTPRA